MKLTKLEHSGIILEKNGQRLIFDPVEFDATLPEVDNVVAVIITHRHGDHLQPEKLADILDRNPDAKVFAPADTLSEITYASSIGKGDKIKVGDFELKCFGENHAEIIPGKIPCANVGIVVDDIFVNPGDSFDLPADMKTPEVLLVPSVAPWCKMSENMEYIAKVKPRIALPVHNAILSGMGDGVYNNWLKMACEENAVQFAPLGVGKSIDF